MKIGITEKAKTLISKMKFNIKKHSPEILISLGVGGVIVSAVTACISTTKVKRIMNESKEKIKEIHKRAAADSEFSEQNKKKALTAVYLRTGVKLIKLYAPSVVLGTFSLTSIVTSNRILRKRSAAIAAAYTAIDQGFKNYRANVVERFGEEVDKELKYGIKTEKVTVKTTDPETGKETKVKKEIKVANLGPDGYSEYARLFDSTCKGWTKDSEYNRMFLNREQSYAKRSLVVSVTTPISIARIMPPMDFITSASSFSSSFNAAFSLLFLSCSFKTASVKNSMFSFEANASPNLSRISFSKTSLRILF